MALYLTDVAVFIVGIRCGFIEPAHAQFSRAPKF